MIYTQIKDNITKKPKDAHNLFIIPTAGSK